MLKNKFFFRIDVVFAVLYALITLTSCSNTTSFYPEVADSVISKAKELREASSRRDYIDDTIYNRSIAFIVKDVIYHKSEIGVKSIEYINIINNGYKKPYDLRQKIVDLKAKSFPDPLKKFDIYSIGINQLISDAYNVSKSFQKIPWKQNVSDSIYFNYLLPYRIANEFPSHEWRHEFLNKFAQESGIRNLYQGRSMMDLANLLHAWLKIKKNGFDVKFGSNSLNLPLLPLNVLDKMTSGSCEEITSVSIGYLRAIGIPSAMDFTPCYLNLGVGHEWAVILQKGNTSIPFDIQNEKIGNFKHPDFKLSKVYRVEYAPVVENHFSTVGYREYLPKFLNNPFLRDVSSSYGKTTTVTIPPNEMFASKKAFAKERIAYLAVFGDGDWKIVSWGKNEKHGLTFSNLLPGGIFLPFFINVDGRIPVCPPFLIKDDGTVKFLRPETENLVKVSLHRKWPFAFQAPGYTKRMIGGKFQISNDSNFNDFRTVHEIRFDPLDTLNSFLIPKSVSGRRYFRYLGPKGSRCNVAEIFVYGNKQYGLSNSTLIGSNGSLWNDQRWTKSKVFDNDLLTYYDATEADSSWVGLDLGRKTNLASISYVARNTKNGIYKGFLYELLYWDGINGWTSLGKMHAIRNNAIEYNNVPNESLLLLRCLTEGREERIFTYEGGKQVWW